MFVFGREVTAVPDIADIFIDELHDDVEEDKEGGRETKEFAGDDEGGKGLDERERHNPEEAFVATAAAGLLGEGQRLSRLELSAIEPKDIDRKGVNGRGRGFEKVRVQLDIEFISASEPKDAFLGSTSELQALIDDNEGDTLRERGGELVRGYETLSFIWS